MQSSKDQQREIRRPSKVDNAKKQRRKKQNRKDQRSLQKVKYIKGTFYAKMDTEKERNSKDLTEAEDIKK